MKTIIRREPFEVPAFTAFDRLFNNFFNSPLVAGGTTLSPVIEEGNLPLDISETDKSVIVRASLPGFTREEIEVEVTEGVLTIKAERKEEIEEKDETYYKRERRWGAVSRRVALPTVALEGDPKAELKDGVLVLTLPKSVKALPKKVKIM